ncbi:hypothetical protein M0R45_010382 [Rubus argutus]|uniref:PPPDE domain-containing protein n=1 Tax=Rubus argutus TaxID=59490 RepID=A0AAW1YA82_RUBAR
MSNDLSQGLARQMSMAFIGKAIEGIWHTGVLVYGNEYYFGGGIQHAPAGSTPYGTPIHVVELGETHVPKDVFEAYIQEISPQYTAETYSLLTHNCNNFSNEVAQFLVGATIPDYILQLPNEVMSSPMGALILPMIQNLEAILKSGVIQVENVPSGRFFQKGFRLLGKCLQFRPPSMVQPKTNGMKPLSTSNIVTADKSKSGGQLTKPEENGKRAAVKPKNGVVDSLGDARRYRKRSQLNLPRCVQS